MGHNAAPMKIIENVSLRPLNTFGVDASARFLVQIQTLEHIHEYLREPVFSGLPRLMLGGGSNVLFRRDFPGVVLHIALAGIDSIDDDPVFHYLRVGAGENWHDFVRHTVYSGFAGLENLSLIPGTVGAAPIQNIGAYGVELKDVFHELDAVDLVTGESRRFDATEAQFGYRDSIFKSGQPGRYLITAVTFRLPRQPRWHIAYQGIQDGLEQQGLDTQNLTAIDISNAVCSLRRQKLPDPKYLGNAGSFFKNPTISEAQFADLAARFLGIKGHTVPQGIKLSAAWLIEQCGWKGVSLGDAAVSSQHALVLVNLGAATGQEIWQLAEQVMAAVDDQFGIQLEPEPRIIG